MNQPSNQSRQALPRHRPQTLDEKSGQAPRFDIGKHEDVVHRQVSEDALPRHPHPDSQDAGKDPWVTNFIRRLAGRLRDIGGKK
jgi:hypothetical protein